MPTNRASAGSTVTFAATALGLAESMRATVGGDEIDVTTLGAARAEVDIGQDEITVEVVIVGNGAHSLARGDTGDVVITPNDGSGAKTFTNMIVLEIAHDSPARGKLTSTIRFGAAFTAP